MLKRIFTLIFFITIGANVLLAQNALNGDGSWHTINYTGNYEDFTIPTTNYTHIEFEIIGADGGNARGTACDRIAGGNGAIINATWNIGNGIGEISEGETLRFYVGQAGAGSGTNGAGGGGGGSAIVVLGGDNSILSVAGGGGGSYANESLVGCIERWGKDASLTENANPGGSDGNGGETISGNFYSYGGGGGGAFDSARDDDGLNYTHGGQRGIWYGGIGGILENDHDAWADNVGGWGFGGGGAGFDDYGSYGNPGGGGGGGYSGGDHGGEAGAAGGGGSYIRNDYYDYNTSIRVSNVNNRNGEIKYRFVNRTDCTPEISGVNVFEATDCSEQGRVDVFLANDGGCNPEYIEIRYVLYRSDDPGWQRYSNNGIYENLPVGDYQVWVFRDINAYTNQREWYDDTHFSITSNLADNEFPTAVLQDLTVTLGANGEVTVLATDADNGSYDDCAIDRIVFPLDNSEGVREYLSSRTFDCTDLGTQTLVVWVYDTAGKIHGATFDLTIIDQEAPIINENVNSPAEAIYDIEIPDNGSITLDEAYFSEVLTYFIDAPCANGTLSLNSSVIGSSFTCADVGSTMSYPTTVVDEFGNESPQFPITLNIIDTDIPVIEYNETINLSVNATSGDTVLTINDIISSITYTGCLTDAEIRSDYNWPAGGITYTCNSLGSYTYEITPTNNTTFPTLNISVAIDDAIPTNVTVNDATVLLNNEGLGYLSMDDLVFNAQANQCYTLEEIAANYSLPPIYTTFSCVDKGTTQTTLLDKLNENFPDVSLVIHVNDPGPCIVDPSTYFITTWETTTPNETITIPTTGDNYNYTVIWGDGIEEQGFTGNASHEYFTPGIYEVIIIGDFPRIYFNGSEDRDKIRSVAQWGTNSWTSMKYAFVGCSNLDVTATDVPDFSNVTNFDSMFRNCHNLVGTSAFNNWDVSTIENMRWLFYKAYKFNQDLSNWNVSNVTDMWVAFGECLKFNQDISSWDVSNLGQAGYMFVNAHEFNQDISNWDVSNLRSTFHMFKNAYAFDQDIGAWDISNVTSAEEMFIGAKLSQQNYDNLLIGWSTLDPGETQIPSNLVLNGGNSQYCIGESARDILTDPSGLNWTITDAGSNCSDAFITKWRTTTPYEIITIPTTGSGYNYTVDWGDGTIQNNITGNTSHTYAAPDIHTIKIYGDFPRIYFNATGDYQKLLEISQWGSYPWSSMEYAFFGCLNLDVTATDTPNLSQVSSLNGMFFACENLVGTPAFNTWNVSTITSMKELFYAALLFNQPLNDWDVSNVTTMSEMFRSAITFNQPLDNWDVSAVENMSHQFFAASSFNQDLGNWDISSLDSAAAMLSSTSLSWENYDSLLIGWQTLSDEETQIPTNVTFHAGSSSVYCLGEDARQSLIDDASWTISDGGKQCPQISVPDLTGDTQVNAEVALTNVGLMLGTNTEFYSQTITLGNIISQNPEAGVDADLGSEVNVMTSLGPSPIKITGVMSANTVFTNAIELYVYEDIPDLSVFSIGIVGDGGGSDGQEFYLSGSATAGDFIYLTSDLDTFEAFFGFAANFNLGRINDFRGYFAIELFVDEVESPVLLDSYGDVNVNGGTASWNFTKGWAYRINNTGPDGGFIESNWRIPGQDILFGNPLTNATAPVPFPVGTYDLPYDNVPPSAVCQDLNITLDSSGFSPSPDLINNNSTDDVGIALMLIDNSFFGCTDAGANQITLTVYDAAGNKDTCISHVNITLEDSQVLCRDKTVALSFNDQVIVTIDDLFTGFEGPCVSEGASWYLTDTEPGNSGIGEEFNGQTIVNSPTDDVFDEGTGIYYESFTFTVPEDGNYAPQFNFSTSDADDLLFVFVSEQPVAPNTGDVTNRPGFLDGFVYNQPNNYLGSFSNNDAVFLSSGTTYYLQVVVESGAPATFSGGINTGTGFNTSDAITYTSADIGENTIYVVLIDDLGRMSYCESKVTVTTSNPFITTWQTDNPNETITIPTAGGAYRYDVDWGDGNINYGVISNISHRYAISGTHTVKITGNFPRIYFNNDGDKNKLLTVEQWGNIEWSSMESAFRGCQNLTITNATIDTPNLSHATSLASMFHGCNTFNGNIGNWDVSNITSMESMFRNCDVFNQDIANWNVSNVTSMASMFRGCDVFNYSINSWNVSNVTTMEAIFRNCEAFNQDLNNWDLSNVTNLTDAFSYAHNFNGNITSWNVDNVTTMADMFLEATVFNGDISLWNVSNVTDMSGMFHLATHFNSDISSWDVGNVQYMQSMFEEASNFNQNISNWNVANVINMSGMFDGAINFNQNLGNWNVASVTDMSYMFFGAEVFNQDISAWHVGKVTNMAGIFQNAYNFDQNLGDWDISSIVDTGSNSGIRNMFKNIQLSSENYDATLIGWRFMTNLEGYNAPSNIVFDGGLSNYCIASSARTWLTNNKGWTITDRGQQCTFDNAFIMTINTENSGITDNNSINLFVSGEKVIDWGDGNVQAVSGVGTHTYTTPGIYAIKIIGDFYFNQDNNGDPTDSAKFVDIQQWGNNKWTTMNSAFSNCVNLQITATDTPDLSEINNMGAAFSGCTSLGNTDVFTNWDLSNVTNTTFMFLNSSFNGDISNWDVSKVSYMDGMFLNASNFNQDLGDWDISNLRDAYNIFKGAALSVENYDSILIGWSTDSSGMDGDNNDDIPANRYLGTISAQYCAGLDARTALINTHGWNFNDDGLDPNCSEAFDDAFIMTINTENSGITDNNSINLFVYGEKIIDWGDGNVEAANRTGTHTYTTPGIYTIKIIGDFYFDQDNDSDPTDSPKFVDIQQWGNNKWTTMNSAFSNCVNLQITATDTPDLSEINNMGGAFSGCTSLGNTGVFANWDVSNVTRMNFMFMNSSFNKDISNWDVSNVLEMDGMFRNASYFNQDLGDWDISNLRDAFNIFNGTALSVENYDAILVGWSTDSSGIDGDGIDDIPINRSLGTISAQYCAGASAREELITTHGWSFNDQGQADGCAIQVSPKVYLQGASLNPNTGEESLMRDDLRVVNYIPTMSPYGDGLIADASVFTVVGTDAIVDWVFIELRDKTNNTLVIDSQSALLQRDGDVVAVDGVSPLTFDLPADNYHVVIKHRNHLGIMSASAIALSSTATTIDFTDVDMNTYGTHAQIDVSFTGAGPMAMLGGDADGNGFVNISGTGDSGKLSTKLYSEPDNTAFSLSYTGIEGYYNEDLDMDGNVLYSAGGDFTQLQTMLYTHPGNTGFSLSFSGYTTQLPIGGTISKLLTTKEVVKTPKTITVEYIEINDKLEKVSTFITYPVKH